VQDEGFERLMHCGQSCELLQSGVNDYSRVTCIHKHPFPHFPIDPGIPLSGMHTLHLPNARIPQLADAAGEFLLYHVGHDETDPASLPR